MHKIQRLLPLLCVVLLFNACQSSRSFQKGLQVAYVDLDYELPDAIYRGKIDKTVYLNPISTSNMPVYTFVHKSKSMVIPLLLFNYWHKNYAATLGESSFTQPYCEFLTDALSATVGFNLKANQSEISADGYSLDIAILENETRSGIQASNYFTIIPSSDFNFNIASSKYSILATVSNLKIAVCLKKGDRILLQKQYTASDKFNPKIFSFEMPAPAQEDCIFQMTDCLASTTREIVTAISIDLNIILSSQ
jgi:hypothetical protein